MRGPDVEISNARYPEQRSAVHALSPGMTAQLS
jgi:hypothetical protein